MEHMFDLPYLEGYMSIEKYPFLRVIEAKSRRGQGRGEILKISLRICEIFLGFQGKIHVIQKYYLKLTL